jgi:hypothetical protein
MDHRSIALCLSKKRMPAVEIHRDIKAMLAADAPSYSSVTRFLRNALFGPDKSSTSSPTAEAHPDDADQAILLALADQPFAFVR